jgi:hypothetical protein
VGALHDLKPFFIGHLLERSFDRDIRWPLFFFDVHRLDGRAAPGNVRSDIGRSQELFPVDLVRVGVTGFVAGDDADARALADSEDGALELPFLEQDAARDAVFDVDLAKFAALRQGLTDDLVRSSKANCGLAGDSSARRPRSSAGVAARASPPLRLSSRNLRRGMSSTK